MQQKGFFRGRLGYHDCNVYVFALTLYGISEQLCYLQAGTKHSVLALFQIIPKSWNRQGKKKSQQQNSFFPLLPSQFCLFFFFPHREIFFWGFFFFESSGLKILGHLGILRASGRSRAEHREVLGRPRQRGLHWSMCLGEGGLRGAKEATYIFRRKNKNEEKKKASPRPAWRTRQHWGLGAGERGEEKGWVDGSEDPD